MRLICIVLYVLRAQSEFFTVNGKVRYLSVQLFFIGLKLQQS